MARQTTLGDVVPDVPPEVQSAADSYLKHKRQIANSREKMGAALDALILRMKEAELESILIDDNEKRLKLVTKTLAKIQARKKNKDGTLSDTDED